MVYIRMTAAVINSYYDNVKKNIMLEYIIIVKNIMLEYIIIV